MFNTQNLVKYAIMLVIVTVAARLIPSCGVLQSHAIYVGLVASSTYALIDVCYPNIVVKREHDTYS